MERHQLISDILAGKASTLSFGDMPHGPPMDVTAATLSALNFARLAFATEGSTPVLSKFVTSLCSRTMVENTLAICREWSDGDVQLEVEDVYRIPLFEVSLKLVSTDYDSPNPEHIARSLETQRGLGSSAAILITRYPDVIACLRLRASAQDIFVLFNPQAASENGPVASLTFSTSLSQITQQLCNVFPLDNTRLARGNLDWKAKPLQKHGRHVFVPRAPSHDLFVGEESLLVSSLTLLTLRAELEELTRDNDDLKKEKQRLEVAVVDLEAQLKEVRTNARRTQSSKPWVVRPTHSASVVSSQGPRLFQSTRFFGEHGDPFDGDEMDPSMKYARQLQATFDSENEYLLQQKHQLAQTAQRQYHCGVCLDDFPEDDAVHIDACGHEICRDCARGHVCAKIEEHRFPVLCPVCMADHRNKNPGTIPGVLVQLLGVSEKQWETWVEMEIAQFSIPFNCRKCQHSGFVDRQDIDAQSEIHCPFPTCDHVWCKNCQQTIDPGGPKHSCDGTSELDHLMKQQGWRYCPNCKTPIQKTQGCNHLSCISPGCNTHFCYHCGNTINRTAIPREIHDGKMAHFRVCVPG